LDFEELNRSVPDLETRMAVNPGEIPGNGIDDDENGMVDDVRGWDFMAERPLDSDSNGHGTQMAKTVLEECGRCQILPLRVTTNGQAIDSVAVLLALKYALARRSKIVNVSFGLTRSSGTLADLLKLGSQEGVVFVAAAGHGTANPFEPQPLSKLFPQRSPSIIVVGSGRARSGTGELRTRTRRGREGRNPIIERVCESQRMGCPLC
jgi:subtilisin family serine protease